MIGTIECPTCEGYGKVWFLFGGLVPWRSRCSTCGGSGSVPADFVGSYPSVRPSRSSLQSLFWSSTASTASTSSTSSRRYRTVRTTVIEQQRMRRTEVDPFDGDALADGDKPSLPLIVDPFAAGADQPETQTASQPDPQDPPESLDAGDPKANVANTSDPNTGDPEQATAY